MGKIKANEIEKHDASQITVNSDTHMKAGTTLSVDTIAEKTSGGGINLSNNLGLKSYTTSQINSLSGMTEGDIVYDSTLGSISVYNGTKWAAMSNSTYTVDVDFFNQFKFENLLILTDNFLRSENISLGELPPPSSSRTTYSYHIINMLLVISL